MAIYTSRIQENNVWVDLLRGPRDRLRQTAINKRIITVICIRPAIHFDNEPVSGGRTRVWLNIALLVHVHRVWKFAKNIRNSGSFNSKTGICMEHVRNANVAVRAKLLISILLYSVSLVYFWLICLHIRHLTFWDILDIASLQGLHYMSFFK